MRLVEPAQALCRGARVQLFFQFCVGVNGVRGEGKGSIPTSPARGGNGRRADELSSPARGSAAGERGFGIGNYGKPLSAVPSPQSLIESTVDNLPLNRLAIGRTENQIEVYELVTEKVFQFFDVSLSLYQHFRYGFR